MADIPPQPSAPPAGADPSNGQWRWDGTTWKWLTNPTESTFGENKSVDPSGGFYGWAKSQVGKKYLQFDDQHTAQWYAQMVQQYGNPFNGQESENGLQLDNLWSQKWNMATPSGVGSPAGAPTTAPTGPDAGAFGVQPTYTPFGLRPNMPGGGGAFGAPMNSRASDSLTPQLEQIRMQRMMQAYPQFGGK